MKAGIVTLFEGHYHLGAAALINSLHASGFAGIVVCGYRGALPPWAENVRALAPMEVRFVAIETAVHFTNYKPAFMQACWAKEAAAADILYYSDPDIVVKAPWATVEGWAKNGLALCEDVNASLPARHPYRLAWIDFLAKKGVTIRRSLERYYNAGFLGVSREHAGFLADWQRMLDLAQQEVGALDRIKTGQPNTLFHTIDQDAMNMALMLSDVPINAAGPEAMDFLPGGHLLSHAAGGTKPWRGGFIGEALRGRPPGPAQKRFYDYTHGPLPVLPQTTLAWRRLTLQLAALIGRFYRRT
ncbi:MAG TPA: hypothetical protein VHO24_08835 [Opitutaceae bacterium]|nr:hypothetical protein [Opitutaceae bacterium]